MSVYGQVLDGGYEQARASAMLEKAVEEKNAATRSDWRQNVAAEQTVVTESLSRFSNLGAIAKW
jgi:hypothetical protein